MAIITGGSKDKPGQKRPRAHTTVPAWRQRKLQKVAADRSGEEAKWAHHAARELQKALKKAKQFEVRKVQRRLVAAKQQTPEDAALVSKLTGQLEATKRLALEQLAAQMVAAAGWPSSTAAPTPPPAGDAGGPAAATTAAAARVRGASCVVATQQALTAQHAARFKAVQAAGGDGGLPDATAAGDTGGSTSGSSSSSEHSGSGSGSDEEGEPHESDLEGGLQRYPPPPPDTPEGPQSGSEAEQVKGSSSSGKADKAGAAAAAAVRAATKRLTKLEKLLKRGGKRPGQRVRRQLLEKLYGSAARHLQAQQRQQQQQERRDAQREQRSKSRPKPPTDGRRPPAGQKRPTDAAGAGPATAPAAAAAALHPSWAAKKQQQQAAVRTQPQGKKVVFDDDLGVAVSTVAPPRPARQHAAGPSVQHRAQPAAATAAPSHKLQGRPSGPRLQAGSGDREYGSVPAEQLHPSWQAKRAAAAAVQQHLKAGGASKVVFADD